MPITWTGILAVENDPQDPTTGDGRTLSNGSLNWTTPIPLRWVPQDHGEHKGAISIGTILGISREAREDGTHAIVAHGTFDHESPNGIEAARQAYRKITDGISVDLDDFTVRQVTAPESPDGSVSSDSTRSILTSGRIRAATMVAIPAVPEAKILEVVGLDQYLELGDIIADDEPTDEPTDDSTPADEGDAPTSHTASIDERISLMDLALEGANTHAPRDSRTPDAGAEDDDVNPESTTSDPSGDTTDSREDDNTPSGEVTDPRRPNHSNSAMIALRPSDPASLALADEGALTPDDLHLTLFFLGDASDLTETQLELASSAAARAAVSFSSIATATVAGSGTLGSEDPPANVVLCNSDAIAELQSQIASELSLSDEAEPFPTQHAPFIPHLTLGYGTHASVPAGTEITFDRLTLDVGDTRISFEWGEEKKKRKGDTANVTASVETILASGPVPAHGGPTVDEPWDGRQAEKHMPTGRPDSYYAEAYAYQTPGTSGEAKDHWRYLHHMVSTDGNVGAANVRACRVLIALLNGARGVEIDLDKDEKTQVYNHLAGHMQAARMDPPSPKFTLTADASVDPSCGCPLDGDPLDGDSPPPFTITAAALDLAAAALPASHFTPIQLPSPTPLTLEPSGHIYGHIAPWNACHIGMPGCTPAPKTATDYAYFHLGSQLLDDGTETRTGTITIGGGHADINLGWRAAIAHYDDVSTAFADVIAYEDEHGIAITGHVRGEVTSDLIRAFRAAKPSGDWRRIAGNLELVGAHMVNTPGYPVAHVAGGYQQALIVPSIEADDHPTHLIIDEGITAQAPVTKPEPIDPESYPILASIIERHLTAHDLKRLHDADVEAAYASLDTPLHSTP